MKMVGNKSVKINGEDVMKIYQWKRQDLRNDKIIKDCRLSNWNTHKMSKQFCRAYGKNCSNCGLPNQFSSKCKIKNVKVIDTMDSDDDASEFYMHQMEHEGNNSDEKHFGKLNINSKEISF